MIAVELDAEPLHGLAGCGDSVGHSLGPLLLDPDDDDRGDVGIAPSADQRPEMQLQIGAELKPTVRMRDRQGAFDVIGDRLRRGIRQIVDRKDDDVIAHPDAAVFTAITHE